MIPLLLSLAAFSCLFLGILILLQNAKQQANILFALICSCFAAWALSVLLFIVSTDADTAYMSAKGFYVAAASFPILLLLFASIFPVGGDLTLASRVIVSITGIAMVLAILLIPEFVIQSVAFIDGSRIVVVEPISYSVYTVYFLVIFASGIYLALKNYIKLKKNLRMQAGLYAIGILINSIPGMVTNLLLPAFGNYEYIWIGPLLSVFFLAFATYSIVKYSLFDIKLAAVRTLAYIFSLVILAAIYYMFAYVISSSLFRGNVTSSFSINPVNILLAIALAFIFQPIKTFFDKITDRIFFRDRYNSDEFFGRLSDTLMSTTELRTLLEKAAVEIGTTLKASQAFFFVQYNHHHRVTAGTDRHTNIPQKDTADLNEYIHKSGSDIIVTDMLPSGSHIHRILASHKISILMPLVRHRDILGYLCLGDHRASGFTNRDIKVLNTVADELVIAIQNSLSVQEIRDINQNLEQRIHAATAELRTSNARLKRLDSAKDEFLSMASHQLRTPLTSVKGYISMMLDGDMGKITPMQKKVLEEAFSSSERMVHLIHDFLNVSRLQTGKFMLELAEVNLTQLVAQEVRSLERVAASRQMTLEVQTEGPDIVMTLDDTKIRQVIMNYIDNAIYYSHPESTIIIELKQLNNEAILKVKDTGIGVPKAEQEQLFEKFYRASNARKQRPDGTGVGIYLARKVVTTLGGDIIFESKEGKGSTFGFHLPIALAKHETDQLADK